MSPAAGRRPSDQTAGSDHLPLLTLTMVGAAAKLGMRRYGVTMKADVTGGGTLLLMGGWLETTTTTGDEKVVWPAVSRALAVSVCGPLATPVVSHAIAYGAVGSSAPRAVPARQNGTP